MNLHAVSLFAGIEGFGCGLQAAGIPTLASVEIDAAARGVIADRLPESVLFDDVREVTADDLRGTGFDPGRGLLTAGFPCQDVSVAGRRAGLAGERTGLFSEIIRIADALRPKYLLLENVPGLLSSHGGRDMGTILTRLGDLGYWYAWRVLDAQFFGVPQRRRRVFIVGRLGLSGAAPEQVLLEPESSTGNPAEGRATGEGAPPGVVVSTLQGGGRRGYRVDAEAAAGGHLIPALTACKNGHRYDDQQSMQLVPTTYVKARRAGEHDTSPESWRASDIAPTVDAAGHGPRTATAVLGHVTHALTSEGADASEDGTGRGTPIITEYDAVRRLTPLECERLQGFPDNWTATSNGRPQSDSARYRQTGNAVAVPVVAWIARRLAAAVSEEVAA